MPVQLPPWRFWLEYPVCDFAYRCDRAAQGLPVKVTSWFRSVEHNRAEGGDEYSQHLVGLGRDYEGPAWALRVLAHRARGERLRLLSEPDHLHIQAYPKGLLR